MTHVHLIGIGGSGLSAIALVLLESGTVVSGSDRELSPLALRLQAAGARVYVGHAAGNVQGADLVVRSSAIGDENVEVLAARQAGIPVLKRAEFLGRLVAGRQCLAVAGTHGKTTTTAMLAWTLTALGRDPAYIIGGVAANLGTNAHAGRGAQFVIEADEYDHMFLGLQPYLAVVTNVEHDHPDCYPTPQEFFQAFLDFTARIQPGGLLLACLDDLGAARLAQAVSDRGQKVVGYGIKSVAGMQGKARLYDLWAERLAQNTAGGMDFDFYRAGPAVAPVRVSLQAPGEHNVRNALAVLGAVQALGLPLDQAARALSEFRGSGRRFELRGEAGGVAVIDDYAHHPTEIRATLAAARQRYPERRLWAVWQPHTYSRTRALLEDFAAAFGAADRIIVTEIFASREQPPADGFSSRRAAERMPEQERVFFAPSLEAARSYLGEHLRPGDVVLVLSAGDANRLCEAVLQDLAGKGAG